MKAIILAAGKGTRLNKYTAQLPKGMLNYQGKTIIERQIDLFKSCGIEEVIIVKGYEAKKIDYEGVRYYVNEDFDHTNMVVSLMTAKQEFDDDIIISYADIVFSRDMLEAMKQDQHDFSVAVDMDWKKYWLKRYGKIDFDTESMKINEEDNIVSLGVEDSLAEEIDGRYVGLLKFSKDGIKKAEVLWEHSFEQYKDKPWQQSGKIIQQAYMTDLLNALIQDGNDIHAVKFQGGWIEFDTNEDYEKACIWANQNEELLDVIFEDSYYGGKTEKLLSYLEFGSIDIEKGKKEIWGYWQHQDAYDLYMFSRYARDLFLFQKFIDGKNHSMDALNQCVLQSAHVKMMDYIFKYAGVLTVLENHLDAGICETGSSLFGFIEEMIATDYVLSDGANVEGIKKALYLGSDISEMMNMGAEIFHPNMNFKFSTADTISKLMDEYKKLAMFYGLSVSLRYALRKTEDLIKVCHNSDIVVLNRLSMCGGDDRRVKAGTGKYAYLISRDKLAKRLKEEGIYSIGQVASIQKNRDGSDSIRMSVVMAKDKKLVDAFIQYYDSYAVKIKDLKRSLSLDTKWCAIDDSAV